VRIAILTFHRANNCGALLQAWALATVLQRLGHAVEFPNCNIVGEDGLFFRKSRRVPEGKRGFAWLRSFLGRLALDLFRIGKCAKPALGLVAFRDRNLVCRDSRPRDFERFYDLVIVGSDQVWNPALTGNETALFLCEKLPPDLPRLAYAGSCGDSPLQGAPLSRLVSALRRFSAVSVREGFAREMLASQGIDAVQVLDPTLLLEAADYLPLAASTPSHSPYLYVYALFDEPWLRRLAEEIAAEKGLKVVFSVAYPMNGCAVTPDEMIAGIAHADCVLASSFHGTVLSTIFAKPFLSFPKEKGAKPVRQAEFLASVGLSARLCTGEEDSADLCRRLEESIPTSVRSSLAASRTRSLDWLKSSLLKVVS